MFFNKNMKKIWNHCKEDNVVASVSAFGKKTYSFNLDHNIFREKVPLLDNIH